LGVGDEEFVASVPKLVNSKNVLYVGLNEWQPSEKKVMEQFDLSVFPPEDLVEDSSSVLKWLEKVTQLKYLFTLT
jgi:arginase